MAQRGRKTKHTTKVVRTILATIRAGYPDKFAAMKAGISIDTFYSWQWQKPEFKKACQEARAAAAEPLVQKIKDHFDKDWRAAAYLLERALPEIYGKQAEVVVNNNTTVQVETGVQVDADKALEMVLAQARQDEVNRCN